MAHELGHWHGQFEEDRVLREILGPENPGFYIDIGACEPVHDSITIHFYESGWHGINVEPVPFLADTIRKERPRDTTVSCAVSDVDETRIFNCILGTQLSTFHEVNFRNLSIDRETMQFPVKCLTLAQLCQMHVSRDQRIDFLKIDVENWERQVLAGADWQTYRPRVLLIEAAVPCTGFPNWEEWEHLVLEAEYDFLRTDDFNRFYVDRHNVPIGGS